MDTERLLLMLTQGCGPSKVLCYVTEAEPWLCITSAALTVVSVNKLSLRFANPLSKFIELRSDLKVGNGDRNLMTKLRERFDFLYLNASHSLSTIIEQINTSVAACRNDMILLLPGTCPPSRGMVGPVASEAWWLGERWVIVGLLQCLGVEVLTTPAAPTGMLVAHGIDTVESSFAATYALKLHTTVQTQPEFEAYYKHVEVPEIILKVEEWLRQSMPSKLSKLFIDPLEAGVVSTVIDQHTGWTRPGPMAVLDLSGRSHDVSTIEDSARGIHGVTIDEFTNAILLGRDLISTGAERSTATAVYGKNKAATPMLGTLKTFAAEYETDAATSIIEREGELFYPRAALDASIQIADDIFLGTPDEHLNFGMWLLYSVPGIRHFRQIQDRYPTYFVGRSAGWQEDFLLGLGLRPDELVMADPRNTYRVSRVATMRQTYRSLALAPSDLVAFDEVGDRFGSSGTPERIYVSRRSWPGHRPLLNEDALIEALEDLGYVTIEPHRLPIREQVRLFRNAKSVVGLGGAAMFNVAFCRGGTRVIDIESDMGFVDYHASLFASRGVEYGLVIGEVDETDRAGYHKRWTIDVAGVVPFVREYG